MNIFYLSHNTQECAEMHVDKHVVKMILEYSQLLSTAHRVLDGVEYIDNSSGRKIKRWKLNWSAFEDTLYKATHINHPSAIWARQSSKNYMWLHDLLNELCKEYTFRYGKIHKVEASGLCHLLSAAPQYFTHWDVPNKFTEPTQAMPDEYIVKGDAIQSYKNYYNGSKQHLHNWKNRPTPSFIKEVA